MTHSSLNLTVTRTIAAVLFLLASAVLGGGLGVGILPAALAQSPTTSTTDVWARASHEFVLAVDAVATTTTLNNGNADTIVAAYDISADPTYVPYASIVQPTYPCTLAVMLKENTGSGLSGTITVVGLNQYSRTITTILTFTGGKPYNETVLPYSHINSIALDLTGTATTDTLRIGPRAIGLMTQANTIGALTRNSVALEPWETGDGITEAATYLWQPQFGTLRFYNATTAGMPVHAWAYNTQNRFPNAAKYSITSTTTGGEVNQYAGFLGDVVTVVY